jgi:hypothetical protein
MPSVSRGGTQLLGRSVTIDVREHCSAVGALMDELASLKRLGRCVGIHETRDNLRFAQIALNGQVLRSGSRMSVHGRRSRFYHAYRTGKEGCVPGKPREWRSEAIAVGTHGDREGNRWLIEDWSLEVKIRIGVVGLICFLGRGRANGA